MNIKEYQIKIHLPKELEPLMDIAYNLWWSWNTDAKALFESISPAVWEKSAHSPIEVLSSLSEADIERLKSDTVFLSRLRHVKEALNEYMTMPKWYSSKYSDMKDFLVGYFSFEYGIHESLPLYSGGLGILSGDHCKSASDMGIPFVAVGLLYRNGYFHQYTNSDGWQQESYGYNQFYSMPLKPALNDKGEEVYVTVPMKGRQMKVKVWKLQVGGIHIVLMDTDLPENTAEDRDITSRLYAGDTDMRIRQEVLLGIGGVRALAACGLTPTVFHLNEGHPAFVGFERFNQMVRSGANVRVAMETVKKSTLFTTHTPVPAGFDVFSEEQIRTYIAPIFEGMSFNINQIMAVGRSNLFDEKENFSMAIAGIRMSSYRNGVSMLHGEVSRNMFQYMWSQSLPSYVPIEHVTNGVHLQTYMSSDFKRVMYQYLSESWHKNPHNFRIWEKVNDIPSAVIWDTKRLLREKLINFARKELKASLVKKGASAAELLEAENVLRPDVLTIGFARRFATYKRALLLFSDENRLKRILLNPDKPVQIVIAGKAHPRDNEGKELIKKIIQIARKPEFRRHIVFLEDYDIEVAKYLTSGADIWLNNPRRPMEASGTSGMKAAVNATLNLSILDGWWVEGFNGENGWAIGAGEDYSDNAYQDYVESHDLYNKLENEIVPLYYAKNRNSMPEEWISMMKSALSTIPAFFNTARMLIEYTDNYYAPLHNLHKAFSEEKNCSDYFAWFDRVTAHWDGVSVYNTGIDAGGFVMSEKVSSKASVNTNGLDIADIAVYTVVEYDGESGKLTDPKFIPMIPGEKAADGSVTYTASFTLARAGKLKTAFAVVPSNPFVVHMFELNRVKWS
ncbi:MAG: alpha-glucan family phosphorylase [Deferribacteraceae bacterium]|nr:alpha-glucan family phosphorylase [Deferribacteraceae bacterium]